MNNLLFTRVGSVVLVSALTISLIPKNGVSELKADETWEKSFDNTEYCTSQIKKPNAPDNDDSFWSGSYVYFGEYEGTPIKFRVLSPSTKEYGGKTMFLDSAYNLYKSQFTKSQGEDSILNDWSKCDLRDELNDDAFLNKEGVFTGPEKAAIAESTIYGHHLQEANNENPQPRTVYTWVYNNVKESTSLFGDKIFIPDVEELSNIEYGYSPTLNSNTRVKGPSTVTDHWLTRSAVLEYGTKDIIAIFGGGQNGHIGYIRGNETEYAVAPALNVDLNSVLFSSIITDTTQAGHDPEYKLTLIDDQIRLKIPDNKKVVVDGTKVTVPYELSGDNAKNVTRLSAYIVTQYSDKDRLLYYEKVASTVSSSGTVSFTIPSDLNMYEFGKNCKLCLVAEDVNGEKYTDYASRPLIIKNPEVVYDIRNTLDFSNADYSLLSEMVYAHAIAVNVIIDENMNAEFDLDKDGVYDVYQTVYTYEGRADLHKHEDCKMKGTYTVDLDKLAPNLFTSKVTFIFSDLSVKLDKVSNGTASLSKSKALPGDSITVTAKANSGYQLDKITYTPEGGKAADITDTKSFVMPNSDVKVNVTFKKTAVPTATATPAAKPSSNPTAKPTAASKVQLALNKSKLSVVCGKTGTLKATLKGSSSKIAWNSSDTKIATVDSNGKITGKMAGEVTITASAAGKSAKCIVTVLYKDVTDPNDFWYVPTNYLTAKGVVKGYDKQTLFKPSNNCTRAQMVTFIWRLMGEPEPASKTCKFKDVKETDYFYKACIWGNENHIVEGYKDGTFGPQIVCARKHAVTFLWRLAGKPNPDSTKNSFKDVKKKDYFYNATIWASEKKILAGYSDGTFRPDGDCLRRQMVTFLYKYDKFINKKG